MPIKTPVIHFDRPTAGSITKEGLDVLRISVGVPVTPRCTPAPTTTLSNAVLEFSELNLNLQRFAEALVGACQSSNAQSPEDVLWLLLFVKSMKSDSNSGR